MLNKETLERLEKYFIIYDYEYDNLILYKKYYIYPNTNNINIMNNEINNIKKLHDRSLYFLNRIVIVKDDNIVLNNLCEMLDRLDDIIQFFPTWRLPMLEYSDVIREIEIYTNLKSGFDYILPTGYEYKLTIVRSYNNIKNISNINKLKKFNNSGILRIKYDDNRITINIYCHTKFIINIMNIIDFLSDILI